ncbi:MAG: 3-deoxy-manno-octulosonate cytidylyltransferase [Elusimicrobiales bacterium]|nr:3-deoxy-manno-octulosonate cytidylyltransferase [Elusimicrobiales bacterium]
MKVCAVIPARYSSTRFPGKVIYNLAGKPVVMWVWEKVKKIKNISYCYIATEDEKVFKICEKYGAKVLMTSSTHQSGTDRVWEVASKIDADIYINVQGDEPFIKEECITLPLQLIYENNNFDITTAVTPIQNYEQLSDINIVKAVIENKRAIYFSRLPVPYHHSLSEMKNVIPYYRHIGIYVYKKKSLEKFVTVPKSIIESLERLEQLRALSIGMSIGAEIVDYSAPAIDVPLDIEIAEKYIKDTFHGN